MQSDIESLIIMHLDLVRRIAFFMCRELPPWIRLDDLIGAGHIGLIKAARDFDPSLGWKFHSFARYRIRGEILDSLRRNDQPSCISQATPEDLKWPRYFPSLDADIDRERLAARVHAALAELPPRYRRVTEMRSQDLTFGEIAAVMGFTESRAHQIYSKSLRLLRRQFHQSKDLQTI